MKLILLCLWYAAMPCLVVVMVTGISGVCRGGNGGWRCSGSGGGWLVAVGCSGGGGGGYVCGGGGGKINRVSFLSLLQDSSL